MGLGSRSGGTSAEGVNVGRVVLEDLLDARLELPLFPDGAGAQPLEHGPGQGEAQGDLGPIRQTDRARAAIGDDLRDRFGCGRRATGRGLGDTEGSHSCAAPVARLHRVACGPATTAGEAGGRDRPANPGDQRGRRVARR